MVTEVKVPPLPESVTEATIAAWHKQVNETVRRDENLVDLETDKVVLEVPAPVDGILKEIRHVSGATVNSEEIIAIIEEAAQVGTTADKKEANEDTSPNGASMPRPPAPAQTTDADATPDVGELSPAARRVATEKKINPAEVSGTGRGGRVTKEDLLRHDQTRSFPESTQPAATPATSRAQERVPMTRIRARIAERLMQSKNSMAMLSSFNEVNLAEVVKMRKTLGESFQKEYGIKLGFMSFFVKAAAEALKRYPLVNASIDGSDIVYHGYQDISIAISSQRGLVTPVLRNVQDMGFADIEKGIADFAAKARANKLSLTDLQGGTFTITNGGTFGSLLSTPIVNPPQSAILGMHAIKDRPIVDHGQIVVAPMMYLAISYDHRIIDGRDAVLFLVDIKTQLENPQRMLLGL